MLESPPGNGNLFSAWAMIFPRGLCLVLLSSVSLLGAKAGGESTPQLTPAAAGPYQVDGNRIVDVKGRRYLVRGTELPTLTLKTADIAGNGKEFGAFSASALISIRQRLNMNAVRLPVSPRQYEESGVYRARVAEVVRGANRFELLAILAADSGERISGEALAHFWARCASDFKSYTSVFFATGHGEDLGEAIRSGGAEQPVLAGESPVQGRNVIYQFTPRY